MCSYRPFSSALAPGVVKVPLAKAKMNASGRKRLRPSSISSFSYEYRTAKDSGSTTARMDSKFQKTMAASASINSRINNNLLQKDNYNDPVSFLRSIICAPDEMEQQQQPSPPRIWHNANRYDMEGYDMKTVTAIRNNDIQTLRDISIARRKGNLKKKNLMNVCNISGETLLHLACRRCDLATVQFLVEEAAAAADDSSSCSCTSSVDETGRTVLHDLMWRCLDTTNHTVAKTVGPMLLVLCQTKIARLSDLFLARDARGHTPLDYARPEHLPHWLDFFQMHQDKLRATALT